MKICMIAPLPPFRGGVSKYCLSLAAELEKRADLLLLSYRRQYPKILYGSKSQIDPSLDAVTGEFRQVSYDIDSANPLSWAATARKIVAFAPEAVVLPWWVAYWAPMYLYLLRFLKKKGIRVVLVCINVFEHENSRLKAFLTRLVLRHAEKIVIHTDRELDEVRRVNPRAAVAKHLMPLFEYVPVPAAAPPHPELRLLFFGFVRAYKGLDVLLRALALLKGRPVSLRIVGEFWNDREGYLELAQELGVADRIEVRDGYVDDAEMARQFQWADVAVLPYRDARTSGVIATAYGFGKPVLATDVGGFREVVRDGLTGRIVAPGQPHELAAGIEWFLANREIDFRGEIIKFAEREMSWPSLAVVIEELVRGPVG